MYDSADSEHRLSRVKVAQMMAALDTTSMVSLSLLLLSKQFINEKQQMSMKLEYDFSVELFSRLLLC
jgi:hypothetical protein